MGHTKFVFDIILSRHAVRTNLLDSLVSNLNG